MIDLERFPTNETALRMLSRISPIYDKSFVAKWLFEIMGTEMEEGRELLLQLKAQAFPETATWGIRYWEQRYGIPTDAAKSPQARRIEVILKRGARSPMNPEKVCGSVRILVGDEKLPVAIQENVSPYTFRLELEPNEIIIDYPAVYRLLKAVKPSHIAFEVQSEHMETVEVPISGSSGLQLISWFNARQVAPRLFLEGNAFEDGKYRLHGYYTRDAADFYPLRLRLLDSVTHRVKREAAAHSRAALCVPVDRDSDFHIVSDQSAASRLTHAGESIGTVAVLVSGLPVPTARQCVTFPVKTDYHSAVICFAVLPVIHGKSRLKLFSGVTIPTKTQGELLVKKDYYTMNGEIGLEGAHKLCAALYPYLF